MIPHRTALLLEYLGLFVLFPTLLIVFDLYYLLRIPLLILLMIVLLAVMLRDGRFDPDAFFVRHRRYILRRILPRFALFAAILAALAYVRDPSSFLSIPLERPGFWLGIVAAYAVLSVIPQGIIFRTFIFFRYRKVFRDLDMVIASAVAFSFMHVIYGNPQAVVLTLVGGFFFADTYRKTESLPLSCLEHALYGSLLFTLGFGHYFFTA